MNDRKEVFLCNLDGEVYLIPIDDRDYFEGVAYYDRKKVFSDYILGTDVIFDSVLIDNYDYECLISGDLG